MTIYGEVKPSSIEKLGFDATISATRYTEIPSNLQMRVEYNGDSTTKYVGYAIRGLAEGTTGWLIHYLQYNASKQVTSRTIAIHDWTDRANGVYT